MCIYSEISIRETHHKGDTFLKVGFRIKIEYPKSELGAPIVNFNIFKGILDNEWVQMSKICQSPLGH